MQVLFLDQNKWIDLARVVATTSRIAAHSTVYERLSEAVTRGSAVAPLAITQIIETTKQNDPGKRRFVAEVQGRLSKGHVYRSRKARLQLEMTNAARLAFGEQPVVHGWDWAVVPGFLRAFEPFDTPEEVKRSEWFNAFSPPGQQYVDFTMNQDDVARRKSVAGFTAGSAELLRSLEERRALVSGADPGLRYRAYAAKLFLDHQDDIVNCLASVGRTREDFNALGHDAIVQFFRDIPTLNVEAEIVARLEGQTRVLNTNDIRDMLSFYTAIPYSSAIVAEKHFISLARQANLGEKYGVTLHTSLEELLQDGRVS
jgi:hypothetical protein